MTSTPPRRPADAGERGETGLTFLGAPVTTLQVVVFVLAFLLFVLAGRWVGQALSPAEAPPPPAATATAAAAAIAVP